MLRLAIRGLGARAQAGEISGGTIVPLWRGVSTSIPEIGLRIPSVDEETSRSLVNVRNTQRTHEVSASRIQSDLAKIKAVLGLSPFSIDVWFCSEAKIRELNGDNRGKRRSTDVLSFPAISTIRPGRFVPDPALEFGDSAPHLGAIVIAPAYVHRVAIRDAETDDLTSNPDDSCGVSGRLSLERDFYSRLQLLLLHSVLHLLGYDHESDEDWALMAEREESACRLLGL